MAVIGKIRSYSKLLIAIVGIALVAFVLGDFIKKGDRNGAKDFAEISGEKINFNDFEARVNLQIDNWKRQTNSQNATSEILFQIREQVWNQLQREIIMDKQFKEIGLSVSAEELKNLCTGDNPHQYIVQSFTNPQTGAFDRNQVLNFVNQFDKLDPATQNQWLELEKAIKDERINAKYMSLIKAGIYITKNESKRDYIAKNKTVNFRCIAAKYNLIDEKELKLTDKDYQNYFDKHKNEFEIKEPTRDLDYVIFNVVPSDVDQKNIENDILKIKDEFIKSDDAISFVSANSEENYDSIFYKKGSLSIVLDSVMFNAPIGTVYGPYIENNSYKLAKLIDVQTRPDSIKASHILISFQGAYGSEATRTKEQAKSLADSILKVINKEAAKFKELANTYTEDPSGKTKGGELPMFSDGAMVGPFNEACITNKVGSKVIVETAFGYHIINIIDKKNPVKKARVAVVARKINPSNETFQNVYNQANQLITYTKDVESFEKYVTEKGMNKRVAQYLRIMDNNLPGLENTREIIRWSFDENNKKGTISKVFEIDGKYIVAIVKNTNDKGFPTLEQIKPQIENFVKIEKKAEMLMNKFNEAGNTNFESIASKMNVKIDSLNSISFASVNMPGVGPEPAVIGTAFGLASKAISKPIKGNSGVFVIVVDNIVEVNEPKDVTANKMQMINFAQSKASYEVFTELQKSSKITDNRGFYY